VIGKSLMEIAGMRGKNPYEAAFDLLLGEENAVGMVDFYGKEEHVVQFLTRPEQNVAPMDCWEANLIRASLDHFRECWGSMFGRSER